MYAPLTSQPTGKGRLPSVRRALGNTVMLKNIARFGLVRRAISSTAAVFRAASLPTASWHGDDPAHDHLKPLRRGADARTRIEPGRASPVKTAPMFTLAEDWERFER